ncbi:MAG: hypothetical protein Q7S16_03745 [bacterium]|nr:hypothetical protein [bacterium]
MRYPLHLSPAIVCVIAFAVLCLLYVWQVTAMSMRNYAKNELMRERVTLAEDVQQSRLQALEHQSLARLEDRLQELQLVRGSAVDYVTREDLRMTLSQR